MRICATTSAIDTRKARIILIEAGPRILPSFTEDLSTYAHAALERLGVEIELGRPVRECNDNGVVFVDGEQSAKVILWAAGVRASSAADWLGVPADHANRIKVEPDLSTTGYPEIFVIGCSSGVGSRSLAAPVAISTRFAHWFRSRGRLRGFGHGAIMHRLMYQFQSELVAPQIGG
jgi:NADH dehydrogenase FAD-containing subunit